MKRKILSIMLILALVAAYFPAGVFAEGESSGEYVAMGQYLVKLTADEETEPPLEGEDGFGSKDSAGRIWTDKSVKVNDEGGFDVTLSTLAQEYMVKTSGSGNPGLGGDGTYPPAADVTFILDVSYSMHKFPTNLVEGDIEYVDENGNNKNIWRVEAMVMAANKAIKTVMEANPNNRVAVHWFGGSVTSTHVGTLMEMNSYIVDGEDKYLNYNNSNSYNNVEIATNNKLRIIGESDYVTPVVVKLGGGTPTQNGIRYGVSKAIEKIKSETPNVGEECKELKRQPYVFILSDGAAIAGHREWDYFPDNPSEPSSYNNKHTWSTTSLSNTGNAEIAAVTILTGMYMKNELENAYT
ncbi:MAG: hypothetical protein GX958_10070, partial [Desulfitobacterium sp.]|nr:hypothetical protein [Desulfitobacterium sp.]